MFNVFGDILHRAYVSQHKIIAIDNAVAKLHYRFTFWLLLACTCLVCSRQYIGEHIRCIQDKGVPPHVVNTFCFFTSTYTVIQDHNMSYAHPGVSPHMDNEKIVRHAYYQWVPFVLFGQALLFYLPHLIWKTFEGGTIRNMVDGLQRLYLYSPDDQDRQISNHHVYSSKTTTKIISDLHKQFQTISRFRINRYWAIMLVFCEMLNLLNVLLQLRVMDRFLGGSFVSLGQRILAGIPGDNPFEIVFPKVTKCDFHKYGPSGTIQVHDAMCIMALNIVNEKIYAILWFWFVILIPVSIMALLWRAIAYVMHSRSQRFNHYLLKETTGTKLSSVDVEIITKQSCFSDWLLLYYLGSNMDPRLFTELLHNLAADLDEHRQSPDFEDEKKPLKGA
ncbi:hypothetical protein PGB90_002886 [Kerria lacca]